MYREGGNLFWNPGTEGHDTGQVCGVCRLSNATDDHRVDEGRVNSCPREDLSECPGPQVNGAFPRKVGADLAEWGPYPVDDVECRHHFMRVFLGALLILGRL